MLKKINNNRILRRKRRISANLSGRADRPRVVVFKSNKYIYAQAIDDVKRVTLAAESSQALYKDKIKKSVAAKQVGIQLGKNLLAKKITQVIFDRSVYAYLGRVKNLAEGLREAGIKV